VEWCLLVAKIFMYVSDSCRCFTEALKCMDSCVPNFCYQICIFITYAIVVTYNMTRKQTAVTFCLCVEEINRSNVYGMVASEMN